MTFGTIFKRLSNTDDRTILSMLDFLSLMREPNSPGGEHDNQNVKLRVAMIGGSRML